MATAPVDVVLDADDGWTQDELPPVNVRIDGDVYTAHCPKDGLPLLLARLQAQAQEDPSTLEHLLVRTLEAVFEPEVAETLVERLVDMSDRKVTLAYILHVIGKVNDHYAPELEKQYAEMGVKPNRNVREPQDRAAPRRAARKAAVKKTAARRQ